MPDPIDELALNPRQAIVAKMLRDTDDSLGRMMRPLGAYLNSAAGLLLALDADANAADARAKAVTDAELFRREHYMRADQDIRADALHAAVRFWQGDPAVTEVNALVTADLFARYIETGRH